MKTIYQNFDKKIIPDLPTASFNGRIIVILRPQDTDKAVSYLLSKPLLGFDTETRPSFRKGHQYTVSLLQVATEDTCFLFRLHYTGFTQSLRKLLEDQTVTKVALSWHDDINSLHRLGKFTPGSFTDIQDMVHGIGIDDLGLQKIYANLFGERISKRQQLSNWEADILNDKQKLYAATDAWACLRIYQELLRLSEESDYQIVSNNEKE